MNRYILNFNYPPITSFPAMAGLLGMVYNEESSGWFANQYIQLVSINEFEFEKEYYVNFYDDLPNNRVPQQMLCPFLKTQIIKRDSKSVENIVGFLEEQLEEEYFIEIYLDLYYFSISQHHNVKHFMHPVLISGFDRDQQIFYITDFFNKKYESCEVPYLEVERSSRVIRYESAVLNKDYYSFRFDTIKLFKYVSADYEFSIDLFKQMLSDYIYEKDSFMKFACYPMISKKETLYGMGIYHALKENIKNVVGDIDVRPFHILYDHKVAMIIRLNYIMKHGYLKNEGSTNLLNEFEKLKGDVIKLRNIIVKYKVSKNQSLLKKAFDIVCRLEMEEKNLELQLLNSLT